MRLGVANNMHPLSWGAQTEKILFSIHYLDPNPRWWNFPSNQYTKKLSLVLPQNWRERERERNARNAQHKMNWQNECQRLIEVSIICGDKPWPLAERKTVSLLYLSIGVEGRRILKSKDSHIMIDALATVDFWKIVEEAFIRTRNIAFDRHVFLITKQLRGETVEHFYGKLKELAENCDFEKKKRT